MSTSTSAAQPDHVDPAGPDIANPRAATPAVVDPTDTTVLTTSGTPAPPTWRTLLSTGTGNALEWFDWAIFGTFSPFFAHQFFPDATGMLALLSVLAVFAVGFVMRPIGSLLFGWYADRKGRRAALIGSIALASSGSLLIGVCPTHAAIGLAAPGILVLARLAQGLGHGGEMPAVQTYLAESAPPGRRGRWGAFIYISGTTGIIVSTVLGAIGSGVLSRAQMTAWGWRVPFLLGGVVGAYTLVMRLRLTESASFARNTAPRAPLLRGLWTHRIGCARAFALTLGGTVTFYLWVIGTPAQEVAAHRIPAAQVLWISVLASVAMIAMLPLYGALADRVGRRPVLLLANLGSAAAIFPLTALLGRGPWQLASALIVAMIFLAPFAAIIPAVYAELFPTGIRATGSGLGAAVATAMFGGTAPYLQTWLTGSHHATLFAGYVLILSLASAAVVLGMPETRDAPID
ncbi:MFS transporter [Nocardia jiangxiensis]|uniref:MFS transporter n=1 Tax=Nocardia jiangxiensis TaxID=282685 RepID=A0ABW6S2J3_9NOCA|nr:MFS transporter [Nocardia jiangxiensis]